MESIGAVIKKHRIEKKMTQEELGNIVFVSKQAISKWENGRTTPDIEMIKKLCEVLEIGNYEILGGSICETNKKRKLLKICFIIATISILLASFFGLGGIDYIRRHTQSSTGYLIVFSDGELLSAEQYIIKSQLRSDNYYNGYKFDIDYGEVCGTVIIQDQTEIEYGFINTNSWHNVQMRLDIDHKGNDVHVTQTVSYMTDNETLEVITQKSVGAKGTKITVFREGV